MSKKQDILDSALNLFTEQGARATSTKSIAQKAGVSEALIFKHFGTKDNLLEDLIKKGYVESIKFTSSFLSSTTPKEFLLRFVELPLHLVHNQFDFWRMQYKILPLNPIAQQYHNNFMNPSRNRLIETFEALGYPEPRSEAELILLLTDNLWKSFVSEDLSEQNCTKIINLLKQKYNLL